MLNLVIIWTVLLMFCVLLVSRREKSGALLVAYFVGLSLIHVPGAINFLGDAPGLLMRSETQAGFELTLFGMASLLCGALIARITRAGGTLRRSYVSYGNWQTMGTTLLICGLGTYFLAMPLSRFVPSLTSLLSAVGSTLIVGIWTLLYNAELRCDRRRMITTLIALPLLPLSTLATGGFLGYGIYWLIAILAFLFTITKKRWLFYALAPVVAYFGLSLASAYFAQRNAIRDAVWYEQAGYAERLDRIFGMAKKFKFYDVNDPSQIQGIDARLNQNNLIGLGIERHEEGATEFLYGSSVPWWALIPRAIWADKPAVGGGGNIVSEVTGVTFASGTSVGVGQPLEFYANFGWPGVIGGFILLGYILMRLDRQLAIAFRRGDLRGVLMAGMPGLALLQPGGNLLEIMVGFFASMIAAKVLWVGLSKYNRRPATALHMRFRHMGVTQ